MSVTTTIETISPATAAKMLERNTMNRPVNQLNLNSLVAAMKKGQMHFTGESIKFCKDGTLLDGQHRLLAIIGAGISAKFVVIKGLEKDSFKYMDIGRVRNAGDVLAIEGVQNASRMAGIVKFVIAFRAGSYGISGGRRGGASKITNAIVSDFVHKHGKSLADSYGFGYSKGKRVISGTLIAGLHYIFKCINEKEADDFMNKLVEGESLTKSHPVHLLRETLIADYRSTKKMIHSVKVALIIKAWNFVRSGKPTTRITWNPKVEEMPKPI